ncbi:chemotaxis protein CheA [Sphingomonas corticis]|jgi:two-component system chemotaxis sensor kinase CheA|uniref:Chemotaxis protein CheA n=1 Tax=Sphingomonas corticis TaxID=2722791 RepID=A0ABX1CJN1_9SPHN|nr:chemotaxis protein CheA [Sphingomonas corticis]NJR77108.1 chemotaxis protein CheA [Sphingomonas corticis]
MQLDEIQAIFFQECEEGLATVETNLAEVRDGAGDGETINTIFRAVHSIKGGAGAFGFEPLQCFSHHLETVLDLLRTRELSATPDLVGLLFAAFDVLSDHVASAQSGGPAPADAAVLARLEAAASGGAEQPADASAVPVAEDGAEEMDFDLDALMADIDLPAEAPAPWHVAFRPGRAAFDNGGDPLPLLRELEAIGASVLSLDLDALPRLHALAVDECMLGWTLAVPGTIARADLEALFDFMPDGAVVTIATHEATVDPAPEATAPTLRATPAPAAAAASKDAPVAPAAPAASPPPATVPDDGGKASGSATIRVELDKLDRLVNLVGELVITQAMLAQRLSLHGVGAIDELSDLDHLTRDLQESAMSIRAQPVKSVFSRVPRIIRELEAGTGKRVRLEVEGEMTEVDKTVVERIGEPLTHMIRNAVDHGLESPEDRVAAGKPAEGAVRLAAEHRSGRIVISVSDDGRGIDTAKVRAKAVERGIIAPDANLSNEEIENLIFAPGFSTAATVSNISGRGVGMDVVRRNVQALGGRIGITSVFGKGSTFTLTLPLTLAILDGMVVSVGAQTYVIPLAHVVESLRPQAGEVRRFGPDAAVLDVRGDYLPILPVGRLLGVEGSCAEASAAVLIVVETDAGQSILMVDGIQDQRQVVVKSLEANYAPVAGLSGATVLGDGRVALILDVETLVQRQRGDLALGLAA